ncbi:mage family [Lecanosticta acicola]|uniref:Mage family n=1 Tax=Lecanosticta acicola TaxID=111012 RepID=A0AAI9EBJ0_9PEZI|nr:mage family [Lecanosticta acicola]
MPLTRKRRSQPEDDSPDGSPEPQTQRRRTTHASDEENYGEGPSASTQAGDVEDMGRKLVRLALACEYQRKPIRRADIAEKVLGNNIKQFKAVFASAQLHLRHVFGMEMYELPAKERITVQQKRGKAAQKSGSQSKPTSTSWILVSILPSEFRNPGIIQPPSAPTSADESKYTAIYTILVSLILLSGGNLPDAKMERYLRKLGLQDKTPIKDYEMTEKLMKRLEKDGYLIRVRESHGTGEDDVYWIVGPRGKVEVGESGVRGLATTVFGDMETEEDEADLDRKILRSLGLSEAPQSGQGAERPPAEKQPKPQKRKKGKRTRDEQNDEDDEDDEDDENEDEDG